MDVFRDWVIRADPTEFWFITGAALLATLAALGFGLRSFWKLRIIVDTPTAKIRSAAQGYVELFGFARVRNQPLVAPLTKTPCVWYRYKVEEERGSGRNKNWHTIQQGAADRPFLLDDGTGQCLVDPSGAELRFRNKAVWHSRKPDGHFRRDSPYPGSLGSLFGLERNYRLTEERIHADEPLYLIGRFETPRRGQAERRELTQQLLRQWKRDPQRMRSFDRNQDGEIDLQEWEAAREQAERLAEQAEARLSERAPLPRVGKTGVSSQPFIISTLGEEALASGLRWRTAGATLATLALGISASLALAIRLGAET